MARQSPNVIDLYQGAVDEMLPTLSAVRADQLTAATPCTDWNVQNLITHNIKIADFVQGIILGNNTTNPFEVGDPLPAQGGREAFTAGTAKVLELLKTGDIDVVGCEVGLALQHATKYKQKGVGDAIWHHAAVQFHHVPDVGYRYPSVGSVQRNWC